MGKQKRCAGKKQGSKRGHPAGAKGADPFGVDPFGVEKRQAYC
jgi:hypothetical protein